MARTNPDADTNWTVSRIATLTTLWTVDGLSASQVARQMGVTRNAVLERFTGSG